MSPAPPATRRRTQGERREAARAALLDAAIECLAEEGDRGLTTRRIAERAGLSQGAVMHHFPNRVELLGAAIERAAWRIATVAIELPSLRAAGSSGERWSALLDYTWEAHRTSAYRAAVHLLTAARTDPDLRPAIERLRDQVWRAIDEVAAAVVPEHAAHPGFRDRVGTAIAAIGGLAILHPLDDEVTDAQWRAVKRVLVEVLAALDEEA